jgi:hypothetical protein
MNMYAVDIYEELRRKKICSNEREFSRHFLGKSDSYYSVVKARKQDISLEALCYLEYVLMQHTNLGQCKKLHLQIADIRKQKCMDAANNNKALY